jgi:DNA-binding transcriptional LysR family regulator
MAVPEQIEALRTGSIDLGVLRLPVHDELIETRFIYEEPLIVALPQDHPLARERGAIRLSQLSTEAFVTYQPRRGFNYHVDLLALCRLAGFIPEVRHEAPTTESVIGIVACGEGVALVPASGHRLKMQGATFRQLIVTGAHPPTPKVDFGLAWHRDQTSKLTQEFVRLATADAIILSTGLADDGHDISDLAPN